MDSMSLIGSAISLRYLLKKVMNFACGYFAPTQEYLVPKNTWLLL